MMLILMTLVSLFATKISLPPDGPPVQEVHKIALEYANIDVRDASTWKKRSKISAILPRFQVDYANKVRNFVDVNVNDNVYVGSDNVVVGPEEGSYKETADSSQYIGVRAVWSLNELIFSRDSLNVSREALNIMRERNALLEAVNKHYFERKKLIGEMAQLAAIKVPLRLAQKKDQELFLKKITMEKETAALDALTGGWFSQQLGP
jgi:hypothetical protein